MVVLAARTLNSEITIHGLPQMSHEVTTALAAIEFFQGPRLGRNMPSSGHNPFSAS